MKKRNIFFIIMAVFWMILIFIYSSKPADESNTNSDAIERIIGQATIEDFSEKNEIEVQNFILNWRIPIRKAAHIFEYALLSILVFGAIPELIKTKFRMFFSAIISFVYCISDEIHQSFVPGRTALVSDVFIDLVGVMGGCLVVFMGLCLKSRKNRKIDKYNDNICSKS